GQEREATIPAREIVERFNIPEDGLEEHLSLLNLVNFGGGCYTVYAELQGDVVHVDKELYGETFRAAPRLTPLEARAIRLALEYVGPMIAADAHTPLDRMRSAAKTKETFEPREGFEPSRLRDARTAKVLYSKAVARWARERGARPLKDGKALSEVPVGSPEWLESEIFSSRGDAIVVEP